MRAASVLAVLLIAVTVSTVTSLGQKDNGAERKDSIEILLSGMERRAAVQLDDADKLWQIYKVNHKRHFGESEENQRKKIFSDNLHKIAAHNSEARQGKHTFTMGLNEFTDKTTEEMSKMKGYRPATRTSAVHNSRAKRQAMMPTYYNTVPVTDLPATVDWVDQGWVGPVQDQGQCGSCWAFSAAASLSAQYYNKTKTFVLLSEQNLVDCTTYLGNGGCNGGAFQYAFEYVMDVGMDSLASYPYTSVDGTCVYSAANLVTMDNGWRNIATYSEPALQQAVAEVGPVSVGINAGLESFQLYEGGVYAPSGCDPNALDHAVVVVGYGVTDEGQAYWLIQNSWGTSWGMEGFMMMARNDNNMCGIASDAGFPVISH